MFFVSFIICIILSVHTIQPIIGGSDAESTVPQTKSKSTDTIFSEAGSITVPSKASSNGTLHNAEPVAQTPLNDTKPGRHRGITKTDDAPPSSELHSNNTKNSSISSSTSSSSSSNSGINTTISNTIADHSSSPISSQIASKNGAVPASAPAQSMQNTKNIKTDQIKMNSQSSNIPKLTAAIATNGTSSSTTTKNPTSTTTTTTTISTTTKKPTTTTTTIALKKPLITKSVEDIPGLLSKASEAQSQSQSDKGQPSEDIRDNEPLSLQSSETISYPEQKSSHNFSMLIIGIMVVIPFLVLLTNYTVRQVRDCWSKRRYRRMDYLIEEMYN